MVKRLKGFTERIKRQRRGLGRAAGGEESNTGGQKPPALMLSLEQCLVTQLNPDPLSAGKIRAGFKMWDPHQCDGQTHQHG